MSHQRVRTLPLYLNADACEHQDPNTYYEEASLSDERFDELYDEYAEYHPSAEDFDICLLTPMGMGVEFWVPPTYLRGRLLQHGYWVIDEDFQAIGWWTKS